MPIIKTISGKAEFYEDSTINFSTKDIHISIDPTDLIAIYGAYIYSKEAWDKQRINERSFYLD